MLCVCFEISTARILAVPLMEEFLKMQNRALLRDFSGSDQCLVALSPEKLKWMRDYDGWVFERLPNCRSSSAFVIRKAPNSEPECWARWNYSGYRKAFKMFLQVHFSRFESILNKRVQVDHLEPKTRFTPASEYYVRLHLVRREVNSGFGAGYERSFYESERTKELPCAIHLSWITYCKASGICLPSKNSGVLAWDTWARERAAAFAKESGELASQAYAGFLSVLQLGYTGYHSGAAMGLDMDKLIHAFERNA